MAIFFWQVPKFLYYRLLVALIVLLGCLGTLQAQVVFGQDAKVLGAGSGWFAATSFGVRAGGLLSKTERDDRLRYQGTLFGRYALGSKLRGELGVGYRRLTAADNFIGKKDNYSTDIVSIETRLLYEVGRLAAWEGWRPYLLLGTGALRYDIADLTARRGAVKPIGWTAQVPVGIGGRYPWRRGWWVEFELGYTFTFSDALNEVDDNRWKDDFWGLTLGLAFDLDAWHADPWLARGRKSLKTSLAAKRAMAAIDIAIDRDGDGLSDAEEARVYFTNPLMADSDSDGLADNLEVKRYTTDPNKADSDSDGSSDSEEIMLGTNPLVASVDLRSKALVPIFHTVFFPSGGTVLSLDAQGVLALAAELLRVHPTLRLELRGFSDSVGSASSNLRLSRHRAEVVRDFLLNQDINPERLVLTAFGEDAPLAPNATLEGRRLNRRVELLPVMAD